LISHVRILFTKSWQQFHDKFLFFDIIVTVVCLCFFVHTYSLYLMIFVFFFFFQCADVIE